MRMKSRGSTMQSQSLNCGEGPRVSHFAPPGDPQPCNSSNTSDSETDSLITTQLFARLR